MSFTENLPRDKSKGADEGDAGVRSEAPAGHIRGPRFRLFTQVTILCFIVAICALGAAITQNGIYVMVLFTAVAIGLLAILFLTENAAHKLDSLHDDNIHLKQMIALKDAEIEISRLFATEICKRAFLNDVDASDRAGMDAPSPEKGALASDISGDGEGKVLPFKGKDS